MVVVVAPQIVHVAGSNDRPPELTRDPDDSLVGSFLFGKSILLNLEVDVLGAERLHELVGMRARFGRTSVEQVLTKPRLKAATECDHAVGVRGNLLEIDRRLAALISLEEPGRGQLDEVAIAGRRGRQQGEMEAVQATGRPARVILDDVHLAAQNRLDPVLLAGGEQLDRAVHHAVIGERQRRLFEGGGARGELVDLARPVEQRVLGMDVEVDAGRAHRRCPASIGTVADDWAPWRPFQALCASSSQFSSNASGRSSPLTSTPAGRSPDSTPSNCSGGHTIVVWAGPSSLTDSRVPSRASMQTRARGGAGWSCPSSTCSPLVKARS